MNNLLYGAPWSKWVSQPLASMTSNKAICWVWHTHPGLCLGGISVIFVGYTMHNFCGECQLCCFCLVSIYLSLDLSSHSVRPKSISQRLPIGSLVPWLARQVEASQNGKSQHGRNKNIIFKPPAKELEIVYLDSKKLTNFRKGGVIGKGILGKLYGWKCTQQDQANVKHEG